MPHWKTVAIVGVGLIGGSIGLGLRARKLCDTVIGIGRRAESLNLAERVGAIHRATTQLSEGVSQADFVVVCTPVDSIAEHVLQAAQSAPARAIITDAGSTKAGIVAQVEKELPATARFVGSHPLAGSEKQGPADARADLFVGRTVVVTPTTRTRAEDLSAVEQFWSALEAHVVTLSPEVHDQKLALTSHLPHVVAAALAATVPTGDYPLTAGGFRDTTRIAAGDPELWSQILLANRDYVLTALERFQSAASDLKVALDESNSAKVVQFLNQAKKNRDALGS